MEQIIGKSFVGWDWDDTCAFMGTNTIIPRALECMRYMTEQYHLGNVIITGRKSRPLIESEFIHKIIYRDTEVARKANPFRWKMAILWKYWNSGKGPLQLYVDNDIRFLDSVKNQDSLLPIVSSQQFTPEKLISWIKWFKNQVQNRKN